MNDLKQRLIHNKILNCLRIYQKTHVYTVFEDLQIIEKKQIVRRDNERIETDHNINLLQSTYVLPHQFLIQNHTKELLILIGFWLSAARQEYNYTIKPLCD